MHATGPVIAKSERVGIVCRHNVREAMHVQQQTHRSEKAGEFNNKLHEDMTLPDADLSVYPTISGMREAWRAGKTDATTTCLGLGCKHAGVTDDMWKSPWKWDPPNPRVREADEYLMRKYRDGLDDDMDDDDSSDDDDDVPGLVPIEQDRNLQHAQIEYAVESIRREVEGDDDSAGEVPTHMIKTPNGRLISKATAVCMLREAFDSNGVISKDRLTRIQQCAQRAKMDVTGLSEHDEDLQLELHKDVALAFDKGDGSPLELWFGRVQKIVTITATGRRTLRLTSIPLDRLPDGLSVMCTYYDKVPRRVRSYRYGVRGAETKFYSGSSIISVVQFDYNPDNQIYKLSTDQWEHIQNELNRLEQSR